ncbi:MAG: hypothetical protein R2789_13295 [Microthrixaceae bacterium]
MGGSRFGVGGVLIAPTLSLEAGSLSLPIINACRAIFGRLRSIPPDLRGRYIVIGLTGVGYLAGYPCPGTTPLSRSLRPAAAVIILFVALLLVPNPRLRDCTHIRESTSLLPLHSGMAMMAGAVVVVAVVMVTTLDTVEPISYGPVFSLGIVALTGSGWSDSPVRSHSPSSASGGGRHRRGPPRCRRITTRAGAGGRVRQCWSA